MVGGSSFPRSLLFMIKRAVGFVDEPGRLVFVGSSTFPTSVPGKSGMFDDFVCALYNLGITGIYLDGSTAQSVSYERRQTS